MKLLMTADTIGGVWAYSLQLARHLLQWDVEVLLATMGALPSRAQRDEAQSSGNVTLCTSEFRLEWMREPWADVDRAAAWLLQLENTFHPDVIHLNSYAHAVLPWRGPKLVVCHSCVLSWWLAVHGSCAPREEWGFYRSRLQQGLRSADYVVAPTDTMLCSIKTLYGDLGCPSAVIPNAVDDSVYQSQAAKEPYVFSAGRLWDRAKNVTALERAGARLAWPVFLAGQMVNPENPCRPDHRTPNVTCLGQLPRERVLRLLRNASIYSLPARYEPFGLSILEAAHSRCALVLGDIPSLRENWDGAAIFVDPDDVDGLAASLTELITYPVLRREYALLAHNRAQRFSPISMAAGYMRVYEEMTLSRLSTSIKGWGNPQCA